jgi:ferredoxin
MRIKVNRDKCTGCRLCLQICAIEHFSEINPKKAALRVEAKFPDPGKYRPYVCIQCGKCAEVCPEDAIHQNEIGAFIVDRKKCTNCGECVDVCPVGVVFQHPDLDYVIICNFCMMCTEVCNTGAIVKWEKRSPAEAEEARNG